MEEHIPIQLPTQPSNKKSSWKALLETGLFEIVFVIVILCVTFGVLNYFNMLVLSKAIPSLSFLPHLPSKTTMPSSVGTSTISNKKPDAASAKAELLSFVKAYIRPSYLPSTLETIPITQTKDQDLLQWTSTTNQSSGTAALVYEKKLKTIQMKRILFSLTIASPSALLDSTTAYYFFNSISQQIIKEYAWQCIDFKTCAATITSANLNKKFRITLNSRRTRLTLIACEVTEKSNLYTQSSTC